MEIRHELQICTINLIGNRTMVGTTATGNQICTQMLLHCCGHFCVLCIRTKTDGCGHLFGGGGLHGGGVGVHGAGGLHGRRTARRRLDRPDSFRAEADFFFRPKAKAPNFILKAYRVFTMIDITGEAGFTRNGRALGRPLAQRNKSSKRCTTDDTSTEPVLL